MQNRAWQQEVAVITKHLPAYSRLMWNLYRDAGLTRRQKVWLTTGLAYTVSPVDLIPGVIPGLGQLDDLAVVLAVLRRVLKASSPDIAQSHLEGVGLTWADLDRDLATTKGLLRRAGRGAVNLALRGVFGVAKGALGTVRWLRRDRKSPG